MDMLQNAFQVRQPSDATIVKSHVRGCMCFTECPKLDDPDYGWVDVDGYKASYGCDKGYELYGSKWRYCNYGKWGGYTPKCHPGKKKGLLTVTVCCVWPLCRMSEAL